MTKAAPVEEQMRVLMRGVEYGEPHIQATMEAELRARLAEGRPLRVYCGFDPTATDLHLGNLIPMLKMRQFQQLGHDVTFLIGTMTGIVGDPTDKTAARQMLTAEAVEANAQTWQRQAFRVLDRQKTAVKRNADWLAKLTLPEVIDLGSHFTVAQFLERESFRQRLDAARPIYLHEFLYALMQAYDALTLDTDVQIGGVDQLFNILAGRELQRDLGKRPLVAVTTPLLIGTDGHLKMSKSVGNYVGLDDPPAEMYGKVMSIPDALIANWLTLLTDVPAAEVAAIERALTASRSHAPKEQPERFNPMDAKKRLARAVVALLHGAEAAELAQQEFERVFQRREEPEEAIEVRLDDLPVSGRLEILALPDVEQPRQDSRIISLVRLISQHARVSTTEARRLLEQGAVSINGQVTDEPVCSVSLGNVIRIGRHRFLRVVD